MTLAEWARIREEERQRREREEQKAENQRRRLARLEAQQQAARLAAQDNRNDYMEDKMNAIDAADEAEYTRVQSVLAQRELEQQQTYDRFRQGEWGDRPLVNLSAGAEGTSSNAKIPILSSLIQATVPVLLLTISGIQKVASSAEKVWTGIKQKGRDNILEPLQDIWNNRTARIALTLGVTAVIAPKLYFGFNSVINVVYHSNIGTLFGITPDYNGIAVALQNKTDIELITDSYNLKIQNGELDRQAQIDPIAIEAAFAVQNQWNIELPWGLGSIDSLIAQFRPGSSTGLAQLTANDLENENLASLIPTGTAIDADNPYVATAGMIERVAPAVELCARKGCSSVDQMIVLAMAQNGNGFTEKRLAEIINHYEVNGQIDWERFLEQQGPKALKPEMEFFDKLLYLGYNTKAIPGNFDTEFMLQRFINNMQELHNNGEPLPYGVTEIDLVYANCLANNLNDSPEIINCPRP